MVDQGTYVLVVSYRTFRGNFSARVSLRRERLFVLKIILVNSLSLATVSIIIVLPKCLDDLATVQISVLLVVIGGDSSCMCPIYLLAKQSGPLFSCYHAG